MRNKRNIMLVLRLLSNVAYEFVVFPTEKTEIDGGLTLNNDLLLVCFTLPTPRF